jgi:N-acetylglucosaminylphosphatidylinositol deacetylase
MTVTRLAFFVLILSVVFAVLRNPSQSNHTFTGLENTYRSKGTTKSEKILLVTAHPDDECLFFAPTLLGLATRTRLFETVISDYVTPEIEIFSLCLSIGDADGLGLIRRDEYERSLDVLGIKKGNRMVLNHPYAIMFCCTANFLPISFPSELQDNIHIPWKSEVIADVVKPLVEEHGITTVSLVLFFLARPLTYPTRS